MNNLYSCEAFGNTFGVKEQLKKMGFRFKKESRSWMAGPIREEEKSQFEILTRWPGVQMRFAKFGENNA